MRLGVGLWTFQSTASAPASLHRQYREFAEDAVLVERLGFDSVWVAEHRSWYDGWCPAPLHALALAAARTERLRLGTAMLLLPQHDLASLARSAATLGALSGGRVEIGAGLGYRDAEFDLLGLRRDRRGRLMDAAVDSFPSPLWIGALAPAALERARRGGHRLMLPQSLRPAELARIAAAHREAVPGTMIGAMRDVWLEDDPARARRVRERMVRHYREEAGSWWLLGGVLGFSAPERLQDQMDRLQECALVGPADHVAAGLAELLEHADRVVIRLVFDVSERAELHEQLARVAELGL